ncbi:thiol peroxidase [Bacteroides sedimenti]|uniref:Thiol peroxidase n=1 Tax=Bacteroides sedimenti TaxID=2136147 RepID=A0ABM8I8D7_9BACE
MKQIKFKGQPIKLFGEFIQINDMAPSFRLVKNDLSDYYLDYTRGKNVVLNIFPSLDTSVCAASVRHFNKIASQLPNTIVLAISKDLPFAQGRFCTTEGIENVVALSDFRDQQFSQEYGLLIEDGPLKGLLARAVIVLNPVGKVIYTELVPDIAMEPDYEAVIKLLK